MKEEGEVCGELHSMERRVDEWSRPINVRTLRPVVSAYRINREAEDPNTAATNEFHKFLNTSGGHTGGWEEQDHLLFLRERRKYNGKPKFVSSVHCLLPDISENEITEHDAWYQKYEELKNQQKEAIRKWRANRHSSLDKEPPEARELPLEKPKSRSFANQRDITDRIKEWKRQQLIKKAEEEDRQRQEQQRQQEERLRKREVQKAKKKAVEQYKNAKLHTEMLSQQMKELQALENKAKKGVLLKAFREQDQQLMERKKMQKFQIELREKQRFERLTNVKPSVEIQAERDPDRVLQPTQGWTLKCEQQHSAPSVAFSLHTIPHLAVPSWRRGLSTQTM